MNDQPVIASSSELGSLGVCHLKRLWSSIMAVRDGVQLDRDDEQHLDRLVTDALGLGLHQTTEYLFGNGPEFSQFEAWIVAIAGEPDKDRVDRLNADINGLPYPEPVRRWLQSVEQSAPVLTKEGLAFWEEKGYVVVKNAVTAEACRDAERAVWKHIGADPSFPETWYQSGQRGIMVELIQHPAFEKNRRAIRIHKAFAQIWQSEDLWVSSDRCGFHPPQTGDWPFPGPDLHWDIDFRHSLSFGTQGILYLTDTPPEQGALTLVPGFHHHLPDWLQYLEPGSDPQQQDLHALGSVPVGGHAGDLIIWNQALPHGSRRNLGVRPRIVQYINMYPGRNEKRPR